MPQLENLLVKREGNVLVITINRASKLNALNQATLRELKETIQSVYDEDEIRGVLLTGAGERAFAAGADISEFAELNALNARNFSEAGQEIFKMIEDCHTPVIAVVNGFALGGGCELAMACHMRVASANAQFGQPEVNLGIVPGYGGTQRLTRLIGKGRSFEYCMTGAMIDSAKALQFGLVNHVMDDKEAAMTKARELLKAIAGKSPMSIEMVIGCVNAVFNKKENGWQIEANAFARCCATEDFKEGINAFAQKRKPHFKGS